MNEKSRPFFRPLNTRTKVATVLLAGLCASILYSRVYLDFERVRVTVVWETTSASGGSVRIPLPDLSGLDGQHAAIVLRLANDGADPVPMKLLAGDSEVGRFDLGARRVARIDLSIGDAARLAAEDFLELEGDGDGWSLEYLEVANVHGFSSGLFAFVIVPASAGNEGGVPGFAAIFLFVALLALTGLSFRFAGGRPIYHATLVAIILALFGLVLAGPIVSDYKLLLSLQAFLLCSTGLYFAALARFLPASAGAIQLLDARVQRWWEKSVDPTMPATAPSWGPGRSPIGLKVVVSVLALWLLSHSGNVLAGIDFLPPNALSADRGDLGDQGSASETGDPANRGDSLAPGSAVNASDLAAYRCPDCSVVLISIDTLRADHLGSYGHTRPTSPEIDALARVATLFSTTIAPGSSTLISHASMMTSLLTFQHKARVRPAVPLADEALTLAEILQGVGFQTAAFVAGGQLDPVYGLTQGFDPYDSRSGRDFQGTIDASMAWLDERPRGKFFLFMHTYEVHAPYTPHERYWEMLGADEGTGLPVHISAEKIDELNATDSDGQPAFTDADARHLARTYDAEIRSVDDAFARLLGELRRRGLYEDLLLILTSDHGEEFGEHGRVGHHSGSGFDEILRVPLIIRFPRGAFSSTRVDSQVRTIDIAPTILEVVGLVPPPSFVGSSLVDVVTGEDQTPRIAISEARSGIFSIRTDRWKYLREQLYALPVDPMEREDLAPFFPAVRNWMQLQRGLLDALPVLGSTDSIVLSDEMLRELRALGYIR